MTDGVGRLCSSARLRNDVTTSLLLQGRSGTSCRWEVNDSGERNSLCVWEKTSYSACEERICHLQGGANPCHFCHPADSSWVLFPPLALTLKLESEIEGSSQFIMSFLCFYLRKKPMANGGTPAYGAPSTPTRVILKANFQNHVHPLGTVNFASSNVIHMPEQ